MKFVDVFHHNVPSRVDKHTYYLLHDWTEETKEFFDTVSPASCTDEITHGVAVNMTAAKRDLETLMSGDRKYVAMDGWLHFFESSKRDDRCKRATMLLLQAAMVAVFWTMCSMRWI